MNAVDCSDFSEVRIRAVVSAIKPIHVLACVSFTMACPFLNGVLDDEALILLSFH